MLSSCMAFAERLSRFYEEAEALKIFLTQLKLEKIILVSMVVLRNSLRLYSPHQVK